ncbi:helix-turn-helix domain-containing protein [Wolbachia pipientis]|uniref:transposase n=1 Tax=Wolbachia pipientis TaxID=955 RepID=UPI0039791343|nr:helix-turn-helix domain-containing protein [Wolbachia pipientis]
MEAIKLVKETGQSASKIAKDLGIDNSTLSDWIKKYNEKGSIEEAFPCKGKLAPCDKEKFKLKKELTRVTRERDIFPVISRKFLRCFFRLW